MHCPTRVSCSCQTHRRSRIKPKDGPKAYPDIVLPCQHTTHSSVASIELARTRISTDWDSMTGKYSGSNRAMMTTVTSKYCQTVSDCCWRWRCLFVSSSRACLRDDGTQHLHHIRSTQHICKKRMTILCGAFSLCREVVVLQRGPCGNGRSQIPGSLGIHMPLKILYHPDSFACVCACACCSVVWWLCF